MNAFCKCGCEAIEEVQWGGNKLSLCEECLMTFVEDEQEQESQESKHCDSGYMNDVRFGSYVD
jgi:hypothetical protein